MLPLGASPHPLPASGDAQKALALDAGQSKPLVPHLVLLGRLYRITL